MPNVAEIIKDHVTLEVRCLDRLYLNAYMNALPAGNVSARTIAGLSSRADRRGGVQNADAVPHRSGSDQQRPDGSRRERGFAALSSAIAPATVGGPFEYPHPSSKCGSRSYGHT